METLLPVVFVFPLRIPQFLRFCFFFQKPTGLRFLVFCVFWLAFRVLSGEGAAAPEHRGGAAIWGHQWPGLAGHLGTRRQDIFHGAGVWWFGRW